MTGITSVLLLNDFYNDLYVFSKLLLNFPYGLKFGRKQISLLFPIVIEFNVKYLLETVIQSIPLDSIFLIKAN